MNQDDFFRQELIKELRRIAIVMKKEDDPERKLYLFSASYGVAARTYRYSFSKHYLLAEFVLNTAYTAIGDRIQRIKSGDPTVEIAEEHFEKLQSAVASLADAFETDESVLEPLETILAIAFSTSGAGNYLKEKGMLEL
ncbi:hypothetical protein J2755_000271 [Methanohalophilus levihalophilus]|uniref:hypothetical protein n=1 Tax=Methanohalophilus levihalophilus TaxID=1431282 RepID=UPI001AE9892C|nr:hypothetical protein [Methanohalophilus levihalophilus]MBP2029351.1 hypothetical protein [Methanohalophilus levihalophilus]